MPSEKRPKGSDRTVVFAGPSLSPCDRSLLTASYRPPAQLGSVLRAVRAGAETIVLIDGYFERRPAVFHKEILWALSRGVLVCGGASMGALRAAELAPFGMIGIGEVYARFASGELIDDDEVAVLHGSEQEGFAARSVALVDIRFTLERAVALQVVDSGTAAHVIAAAQSLFYPYRRYDLALSHARRRGGAIRGLRRLAAWLPANAGSQKRADARCALRAVASRIPSAPAPRPEFVRTRYWEDVMADEVGPEPPGPCTPSRE